MASGATERTSAGKGLFKEWKKLRVLPRVQQSGAPGSRRPAVIQEVDEDESGWIFGVVSRSGVAAMTDRDEVWDELVLDGGSVSTASPYAWCADIRMNDKEKAYLQDVQQCRIPSHGSRVVPLELRGSEGNVQCLVKFDVADVAYPVVSLGRMIDTGFMCSFDDYNCYMHKGNRRVEIFRKGRMFVLRMRRRWLKVGMVAPIDGPSRCGEDEEMGVTEDSTCVDVGTGAAAAAAVGTRVDEPGDDPPAPRPSEVRPCSTRPGAEAVRQHNPTHCPYQSWCEVCIASKGRSDHYHKEAPESKDGDVARVQMDFMFFGAEGSFVDGPTAKATVLMVICRDDGNLAATVVRTKTDEYGVEMVLRFLSTYEYVEIKTDGEPSIVEIARRVQSRRDRTTSSAQSSVGREIGAVERAKGTVQAQLRAYYLDVEGRMKVRVIPGTQLFPWMLRHSVWTVVSYQDDQKTKQGCRYESALVPFGEVVMAKIVDGDKLRAGKLDSAWVKAVWVGRVDTSSEHLLLTAEGCIRSIRSRVVRHIPDGNQASYHAEVQELPWDTFKGSAEMLRNATIRPGEPPKRGQRQRRPTGHSSRRSGARCHAGSSSRRPNSRFHARKLDDHIRQPAGRDRAGHGD